jgi:hypothetical protein
MADVHEKIAAELENIQSVVQELKRIHDLSSLTVVELAGTGALLHNFYNGIENILKQVFLFKQISIPSGSYWHRDLLDEACVHAIILPDLKGKLGLYLAFRHFFVHGYTFQTRADRLAPLVEKVSGVFEEFIGELRKQQFV